MKIKNTLRKTVAIKLLLAFLIQIAAPTSLWALTGGPSQPEVQSFEPVNTSEMVDLFSGDFVYNIPLLDVEGYPINLSYHSGIGMDDEASWVGLGWNINAGVINRTKRGIPDDFDGDEIETVNRTKTNCTIGVGVDASFSMEALGIQVGSLTLGSTTSYNNFYGFSTSKSLSVSTSASKTGLPFNTSLGLNLSNDNGASINQSISTSLDIGGGNVSGSISTSIGGSYNSRAGLRSLTISSSTSIHGRRLSNSARNGETSFGGQSSFNIGGYTATPTSEANYTNKSFSFAASLGAEIAPVFSPVTISASISTIKRKDTNKKNQAYGYLNSQKAGEDDLMDYNMLNDKDFSEGMIMAGFPNFTNDFYQIQAQGNGGNFRPFRYDIGVAHNAVVKNSSELGVDASAEFGGGAMAELGVDVGITKSKSRTGPWTGGRSTLNTQLKFKESSNKLAHDNYYFKSAGELSVDKNFSTYTNLHNDLPIQLTLNEQAKFNVKLGDKLKDKNGNIILANNIAKDQREVVNNNMQTIKVSELSKAGLMGAYYYSAQENRPGHHIGEIVSTNPDGARYVYGYRLYNELEEDVMFALGRNNTTQNQPLNQIVNQQFFQASYSETDASEGNNKGRDGYYKSSTLPEYAHSYMLSAVLSNDYIDSDETEGPSDGDFGSYTKFSYQSFGNYKWRVPYEEFQCNYNEGLKSDYTDDRGSFVYGIKDIAYLEKIETKNYVAVFELEKRCDGRGVKGRDGGKSTSQSSGHMYYLKSISLYTKPEYRKIEQNLNGVPIKVVHFEYDYSLCPGISNFDSTVDDGMSATGNGKLTLKKIYFTYQNSNKGKFATYDFNYGFNPSYNIKNVDRWGTYKANPTSGFFSTLSGTLYNWESPYTLQDEISNEYASAWSLVSVKLPTGGVINIEYESDQYASVQHKEARMMMSIVGTSRDDANGPENIGSLLSNISNNAGNEKNKRVYFELVDGADEIASYVSPGDLIFYKALVAFDNEMSADNSTIVNWTNPGAHPNFNAEYIPGYAKVKSCGVAGNYGWVLLEPAKLADNTNNAWSEEEWNPITKSALDFARANLKDKVYGVMNEVSGNAVASVVLDYASSLLSSYLSFGELLQSPNKYLYNKPEKFGRYIINQKSQIRLKAPNGKKYGGGTRVKKITVSDGWNTNGEIGNSPSANTHIISQEFEYLTVDGKSSGVASNEPEVGGEENALKHGVYTSVRAKGAPDPRFLQELPIGMEFFPAPEVGYSRVVTKTVGIALDETLNVENGNRIARTGSVVHEFYTNKEFPTLTDFTKLVESDNLIRHKTSNSFLSSFFKVRTRDFVTLSQGISIVTNDMHGKPKSIKSFAENTNTPYESTEYKYKCEPFGLSEDGLTTTFRLTNKCTTIDKGGSVNENNQIGVFHELMIHERENTDQHTSVDVRANIDLAPPIIPLPSIWPTFRKESTMYRSITTTKIIQKFGLIDEVITTNEGAITTLKNLAYDAQTGDVLLTSTNTNFNDYQYFLDFPAYWYYDGMGLASGNLNVELNVVCDGSGKVNLPNANTYFYEGDELLMIGHLQTIKGWVVSSNPSNFKIINRAGDAVQGSYKVKVIRSGHRNMQMAQMMNIVTGNNPLSMISSNAYQNVLQSSAVEYKNEWPTNCYCEQVESDGNNANPFINGRKGVWKAKSNYLHLTTRNQTSENGNTNIRKDGYFQSFNPFYKRTSDGNWQIDYSNWTFTSEVSLYSPYGVELENRDALGRYSSAMFGFNQSLPFAIASNSSYKEINYDGFEDYLITTGSASNSSESYVPCSDMKFRIYDPANSAMGYLVNESHTGRNSLKVVSNYRMAPLPLMECLYEPCSPDFSTEEDSEGLTTVIHAVNAPVNYRIGYMIIHGNPVVTHTIEAIGNNDALSISGGNPWTIKVILYNSDNVQVLEKSISND